MAAVPGRAGPCPCCARAAVCRNAKAFTPGLATLALDGVPERLQRPERADSEHTRANTKCSGFPDLRADCDAMPDLKSSTSVSKGVARGHILCCCAVVFVCFMLTCLNLYMLSSTRAVLRHLDSRFDTHPRALQRQLERQQVVQSPEEAAAAAAAMLLQQQQLQQLEQTQGADDFILLAPSDLDNAWTTQTGRLLVPVGQPEEDDDGWKQMQVSRQWTSLRPPSSSHRGGCVIV